MVRLRSFRGLYKSSVLAGVLLFGICIPSNALEISDMGLHLWISSARSAGPPTMVDGSLVFTHKTDRRVRFIGVSFAHEDFKQIHTFVRNQHGVYLYPLKSPPADTLLAYRIVVDGLWMTDPFNNRTVRDAAGNRLSVVRTPPADRPFLQSPVFHADGTVEFRFGYSGDATVHIAGTFNSWDPFMHRLHPTSDTVRSIRLRLAPGKYYYYFVVEGRRIVDALNPYWGSDPDGNTASEIVVPSRR